ncbi:hypothetical protein DY000_02009774 [Brassica cretica]|uniref:Uncharacterized protein n=1 Tax=Brassica cretica TaxID=69181 RepID=A0ABQ7CKH3_BRACR|nr:hypothetical protein DY000_02009774 [Brassica cretica]
MSFATQLPSISARFSPTCSSCCGKWVFSYSRVKPRDLTLEPTDRAVAPPNSGQAFLFLGLCGMVKSILYSGGWKFRGGEEGCGVFGGGASGVCGDVVGGV